MVRPAAVQRRDVGLFPRQRRPSLGLAAHKHSRLLAFQTFKLVAVWTATCNGFRPPQGPRMYALRSSIAVVTGRWRHLLGAIGRTQSEKAATAASRDGSLDQRLPGVYFAIL